MTRLVYSLILLSLFFSCKKKKFEPYIGIYNCEVSEHLDSNNYSFDTIYYKTIELLEVDSKTMQFLELPIPYKFIDLEGNYETSNLLNGIYWGRNIGLRNDSVDFFHYEGSANKYWSIKYKGIK